MGRNGVLMLLAAVLISVGVYFFLHGETATDDTMATTAERAVVSAPAGEGTAPPTSAAPATDLIPSNE